MGYPDTKKGMHMYDRNEPDDTLVMLTLAGQQTAYEILVTRYQAAVIAAAAAVTKNHFMAEDAAQDAFVTAWMKLNTLQEPKKYGAWVCRIAKNCALNMIRRYRSFLPLDAVEYADLSDGGVENPAELYALSEERDDVNKSLERLPEKVRQIIYLHYFEDLSIAEIADRMRLSEGTVKWQLHDGRRRIRKELCAMNETYSDTLVQRVMKKVEELKLWQVKNDKSGFEKVYKDVLRDVEDLPECKQKQHALADVLMRGWWWLPGDKNDAMFARIREAALEGKNDDVMEFIVTREDGLVSGDAKIDFIRDKQIPLLERAGLVRTLAREWFWLGYRYFRKGQTENGYAAFDKVQTLLTPADRYYALVVYAREVERKMEAGYRDKSPERFLNNAGSHELHWMDGALRYWNYEQYGEGYMNSVDRELPEMLHNLSRCDGWFFDSAMKVGETRAATDGITLTFVSDDETVETPCGTFGGCQLWVTGLFAEYSGYCVNKAWYKEGVGIVKYERAVDGLSDVRLLKDYRLSGGRGLLPLAAGNTWAYADTYDHDVLISELRLTVTHADSKTVMVASRDFCERLRYDESSWLDMIQQIRNEYWIHENGQGKLGDISVPLERVGALAVTPMEIAHTKAALSVARRIIGGVTEEDGYTGHWNFFAKLSVMNHNGKLSTALNHTGGFGEADTPLLFNDIYGILQDATSCIWSDEWRLGMTPTVEYDHYGRHIRTHITCEDGGSVTTKAGVFDGCLKLVLDIHGMTDGWSYRGGKKVYYFAEGIGIVRTENEYCDGARTAVYELTAYEGRGEGYMPMADGLFRRYDALGLTDGFVGAVEYTYVQDADGHTVIFRDATGIRKLPPPITQYSSILDEMIEDKLWNEGKHDESRLCHDVNNFHLLCHFLGRPSRYRGAQEKAVVWNKYRLKVLEGLDEGTVPAAWLGLYASTAFRTACALFGCGKKEEGYEWLERAFEAFPTWDEIPDGTEMDVGDPLVFGGVKVIKGKSLIKLPDGTTRPISYNHLFGERATLLHYGLTAQHGWEWFNSVRDEERFKAYVERARDITDRK